MEINQAYKRSDGTYVVDGYHVCPKEMDQLGIYDISEVEAYLLDHPEALIPEPVPPEPTAEEVRARKVAEIDSQFKILEAKAIRPCIAFALGRQTSDDMAVMESIDSQARALRAERAGVK